MIKSRNTRKILKPSREELASMIASGMTPYQIADKLGYSSGGWSNIYKYCRDYGIKFDYSVNHDLRAVEFTQRQKDIMYGSLLGDAYIRPGKASSALSFTHGEKQLDYLLWKLKEFDNFVATKTPYKYSHPFHGNAPTYSFSTITHPEIDKAQSIVYPNGKKVITEDWIKLLSPLSLAVWYLDDGSLNKRYGTIVFCTNSFSVEEQSLLIDFLEKNYSIHAKLERRRNNQFVLRVNASESKLFRNIIAEYVPPCMDYKLG